MVKIVVKFYVKVEVTFPRKQGPFTYTNYMALNGLVCRCVFKQSFIHSFREKVVSYPKNLLIYTNIVFLVNLDAWYADI